ncbi:hypothetical protein [Levilactobacillus namurensis]|uniref:hypothetical protein n=1 Tax=Levilactobacillus namurensis TaxID=380393 RepID=UPI001D998C9F|nr:hypothetical protein [Levilactobacillus namurensis]HJE46024.1 hypothetical protein [Levilactobacillus namurensis]
MTSFKNLFCALWKPKLRTMNRILLLWALAIVVTWVVTGWSQGYRGLDYSGLLGGWTGIGSLVGLVGLAAHNERVVRNDSFRLIPVSATKLYLTNLLATFGAYLYLCAVETVAFGLSLVITHPGIWRQAFQMNLSPDEPWLAMGLAVVLVLVLLLLGSWIMITLIHLVVNALSAFVPGVRQRVIKVLLAIVVVWGLVYLSGWLLNLQTYLTRSFSGDGSLWISLALMALAEALAVAVNIYLLKHWTEARY